MKRTKSFMGVAGVAAVILLLGTGPASADLITFTGAPLGPITYYEESGFKFTYPYGDHLTVYDVGGGNRALKDQDPTNMYGSVGVVQRIDGLDFTLDAIEGANFGSLGWDSNIRLYGRLDGVWVLGPVDFYPTTSTFQPLDLSGSFQGVQLDTLMIQIRSFLGSDYAVDNIEMTVDTTPPEIDINLLTDTLWPPNHKMVKVAEISATDDTDPAPTLTVEVTSNEPINGPGDGNTEADWEWDAENGELYLRAERSGGGDGRVYTITVTATDASGNSASETEVVTVPHDKGKGKK